MNTVSLRVNAAKYIGWLLWLCAPLWLHAQALDNLGFKKGIVINGSVAANTIAYTASGAPQRRDPFTWYATGNLNIVAFGYAMPFSFSYSNQSRSYSQPFNQFRFAPTYKWARAYFGTTGMTFSNYTLAGHLFNGVGLELSPGKWRIATMYGSLQKPVPYDVNNKESYQRAAFERKGYGAKLGYENNGNSYAIAFFQAKDDPASIPYIPDDATVTPQQNLSVAVTVKQHITRHIFTDLEYSVSALNRDMRSGYKGADTVPPSSNFLQHFFKSTASTRYFDAIQAGIGYQGGFYSLQLRYERVAPDYTTLGAYNVVNDMRNITVAPMLQLWRNKITLSGNAGVQTNNLDKTKNSATKRWVTAANLNFIPEEHWAFSGSYSNFSNYTHMRPLNDPYFNNQLDTLDFYQVSTSYNTMIMRWWGDKQQRHTVTFNASYQRASDNSSQMDSVSLSNFYLTNASYTYSLQPTHVTLTAAVNYYQNHAAGLRTSFMGPSLSIGKQFYQQQLRTAFTTTYNVTKATAATITTTSGLLNTSFTANYSPKEKKGQKKSGHSSIGGSLVLLYKQAAASQPAFTEFTSNINYIYSF